MADSVLINNAKINTPDVITILFTSPVDGDGTVITAFTATNDSGIASVSYKAYIFDKSETLVSAIVPQKIVVKDRFDSGPSIVNQVVPAGGTIRAENSTANGLNFYSTGQKQTSV